MEYSGNILADMYDEDRERKDDGDEPLGLCPECGEEVPVSELKSDKVCKVCFEKEIKC